MSRLPALKPGEVVRKLRSAGFQIDPVTESQYVIILCGALMAGGLSSPNTPLAISSAECYGPSFGRPG